MEIFAGGRPARRASSTTCPASARRSARRWSSTPTSPLIAFTGSRGVGLLHQPPGAPRSPPGQDHVKRVIAEMGGKNAIIVDDDADLDEAVARRRRQRLRLRRARSARPARGPSCSERSTTRSSTRLVEATQQPDGRPGRGPRLRSSARSSTTRRGSASSSYIEKGKAEARLAYAGDVGALAKRGLLRRARTSSPTCRRRRRIAQEEIFGPVLAVMKAQRPRRRAARSPTAPTYALTGGLLLAQPGEHRARPARVPRRQPLHQPQDHRRPGRPPAVRRLQAVRHRLQGRRPGLPAAVPGAAHDHREHAAPRLRPAGRHDDARTDGGRVREMQPPRR